MDDAPIEHGGAAEEPAFEAPVRASWLPSDDPLDQNLEMVIWAAHSAAAGAALQLQQMDKLRRGWQERHGLIDTDTRHPKWRSLVWELSAALTMPKVTVENKLGMARVLIEDFPATFSKMRSGVVSERHASILIGYLAGLTEATRIDLEDRLLPYAEKLTLGKFELKVRTLVELRDAAKMDERHEEAMKERDIWVDDQKDGMAVLSLLGSAVDVHAAANLIGAQARALKAKGGDAESRGIGQIRSDVLRDMLLDGQAQVSVTEEGGERRNVQRPVRGILPTVAMTVPVLSMIELTRAGKAITPAILEGYGPIAPSLAAKIAGAATGFTRILTDPHTGAAISVGTEKYRPPAEMRATIIRQDGTCRGVGCNRPAKDCDLDHTVPASDGGPTELANLAALCPNDHDLKHHGGWTMIQGPGRRIYWVSPLGRIYDTEPEYNLPIADLEDTINCMDPSWLHDEEDKEFAKTTVEDPDWCPF